MASDIPPDIWMVIFSLCQTCQGSSPWTRFNIERPKSLRFPKTELVVASVCREWRNIALDHSELWTYIRMHGPLESVKAYFERSRSREVHLIWVESPEDRFSTPSLGFLVAITHSNRWKSVTLRALQRWPLEVVLGKMEGISASKMEHFGVGFQHPGQGDYDSYNSRIIFGRGTPLLRTLVVSGLNPTLLNIHFYPQITSLRIILPYNNMENGARMGSEELCMLLRSLSSLETLVLKFAVAELNDANTAQTITMLTLRHLSIATNGDDDDEYPRGICRLISAPNLESLRFRGLVGLQWRRLFDVYQQSAVAQTPFLYYPRLRLFEMSPSSRHGSDQLDVTLPFLQRSMSIEHLALSPTVIPTFVNRPQEQNEGFLPLWHTITFRCSKHQAIYYHGGPISGIPCVNLENVEKIIQSRFDQQNGNSPITKIRFLSACLVHSPEIRNLERFGVLIEEVPLDEWVWW